MRGPRAIFAIAIAAVAAMAAACRPAHAAELAYLPNQAGGQIVLTDTVIDLCDGRPVAFARTSGGKTLYGCWQPGERFITIEWSDGDFRTYPIESFQLYRAPDDKPLRGI